MRARRSPPGCCSSTAPSRWTRPGPPIGRRRSAAEQGADRGLYPPVRRERWTGRGSGARRPHRPGRPAPTHIVAAALDPLCAEAGELAERMRMAGVEVSHRIAPGMIHGFLRAAGVSAAVRDELARAAATIRPLLSPRDD
ncbi:alpha/beta hydrolase [Rhizorhabdus histidinilytica]